MHISSEKISQKYVEVNSCAVQELNTRDRHMVRPAGRVDFHLLYIMRGYCHLTEEGRELTVGAGHLILYLPHERQEYAFRVAESAVSGYVHFSGTGCEQLLQSCGFFGRRVVFIGESGETVRVFRELADEFLLKKPLYEENSAALLQRFLSLAGRAAYYAEARVPAGLRHSMDAVCKVMHREYAENHSIGHYAALCHLSEGRFSHAFKESTGISPKQYLLQIKVDVARQLLAATDLSVGEVAEAVGIADVNYFGRLFKKYTGSSPGRQR